MQSSTSLFLPLVRAAGHLAESAQRAIVAPAQALREEAAAQQPEVARATAQFIDAAQDTVTAVGAATRPYRRQAERMLATSEDRLQSLGRRLVPASAQRGNLIARHPYATTLIVLGVGYLTVRRWRRRHAEARAREEDESDASAAEAGGPANARGRAGGKGE